MRLSQLQNGNVPSSYLHRVAHDLDQGEVYTGGNARV